MKLARMVCVLLSFAALTLFAENALPEGYTRLEWIESSGSQYIATGYTPLCTDKVTVRFQFLDASFGSYQALYCARLSGKQTFTCQLTSGSTLRFDYNDGTRGYSSAQIGQTDHLLVVDGNTQTYVLDGSTLSINVKEGSFTVGSPFYLFRTEAENTNFGKFRLYYFKVEDAAGNVKVDMRPCRNDSGEVGLYDFAEGRMGFYGNAGSNDFIGSGTTLPAEYVACDWVDSSGTQWLNTEVRPVCLDKVETKVRFHDTLSGEYSAVFCARGMDGSQVRKTFTCIKSNGNFFRFDRNTGTGDGGASALKPVSHVDYRIEMDAGTQDCRVDGKTVATCGTTGGFVVGSPFVLFAGHNGTISDANMTMLSKLRVYSFKVLDPNGAVISDLKPCRRVADGKVGVYDIINKKFLTNGGTGALTAPRQTLPSGYTQKEWVRSTGTQYLDTGYWPSQYDTMNAKFCFKSAALADYQALFCARTGGKQTFTCQLLKSGRLRFDYNDGTRGSSEVLSPQTDYEVEVNGETQTYKLNGETISGIGTKEGAFAVGSSVHLFGSELGVNLACLKMYSYKAISKDGVTMCNCVPCVRNADDVVGMYDLANDRFLENQGAGKFGVSGLGVILVVR